MDVAVERLIEELALAPHPEGGFYREVFRSPLSVHRGRGQETRSASTSIYYLLPAGTFSAFHLVRGADEVWHHYAGGPVELHTISRSAGHTVERLGDDLSASEHPQIVVPADRLQAAVPAATGYALCGCTVAPGFDFSDFVLPAREELLREFPEHAEIIHRLTRE